MDEVNELKNLKQDYEIYKKKTNSTLIKLGNEISILKNTLNSFIEARDAPLLSRQCISDTDDEVYGNDLVRARSCLYSC